jgi:hypothetical protein
MAVQRRDRDYIEDRQREVDDKSEKQQAEQWRQHRVLARDVHVDNHVDDEAVCGKRGELEANQQGIGNAGRKQVGAGSRQRDQNLVAPGLPEVQGVDRDRFRPAYQGKSGEELQQREQERADGVNVCNRIERNPSQVPCRIIAAPIRHPCMRSLMDAQREEQDRKLYEDTANINVFKYFQADVSSW